MITVIDDYSYEWLQLWMITVMNDYSYEWLQLWMITVICVYSYIYVVMGDYDKDSLARLYKIKRACIDITR